MSHDIRDYHAARNKITAAPLTLTEKDFDVLDAFNPEDERRGRDAVKQAQLAIVAANIDAIPKSHRSPSAMRPEKLGEIIAAGLRPILVSYRDALADHTKQIADLKSEVAALKTELTRETAVRAEMQREYVANTAAVQVLKTAFEATYEPAARLVVPPPVRH